MSDLTPPNEKKFLAEFRILNSALHQIKDSIHSVYEEYRRKEEQQNAFKSASSGIDPKIQIQKATQIENRKNDKRHLRVQRFIMAATWGAFIAASVYGYVAIQQWKEMIGATDASTQAVYEARLNRIQSEKSLNAAIDQFHLDQRAWVGIVQMTPGFSDNGKAVYIKEGANAVFDVVVTNSGKTPALKVRTIITAKSHPPNVAFTPIYSKVANTPSVSVIQPGEKATIDTPPSLETVRSIDIDAIKSGSVIFYFYGKITYEDIFRKPHETTFCAFINRELTGMSACENYNDAN